MSHRLVLALLACVEPAHSIFGRHSPKHWPQAHEDARVLKRDGEQCSVGLYLCVNGGCCPDGRDCGITDCPAKSRAPATAACGQEGYTACAIQDGGGCCPSGFACARTECIPPAGFTATSNNCQAGSRLCGAEFGYGCCGNDLDCGISTCYPRTTSSFVATLTVATTDAHSSPTTKTLTVTTAFKPSRSTLPTSTAPAVPMVSASGAATSMGAVLKTSAYPAASSSRSGLSKGVIAGMVTGVVLCLVAMLVASFFVIRRLNAVARRSERSQSTRGQYSDAGRPAMKQMKRPQHYHANSGSETLISNGRGGYTAVPSSDSSAGSISNQGQMQDYFTSPGREQIQWYGRSGWDQHSDYSSVRGSPPPHNRTMSDDSVTSNSSLPGRARRDTQDSNITELEAPDDRSIVQRTIAGFGGRRPSLNGRRSSSGQDAARGRGYSLSARLEDVVEKDASQPDLLSRPQDSHASER